MNKIPCKKCLLSEVSPGEELEKIKKLIDLMPDKEKVSDEEYANRLDICKSCDYLNEGTCMQCGCYAELRAIKKKAGCPVRKW